MSRTLKTWRRSVMSVSAALAALVCLFMLVGLEAEAACELFIMPSTVSGNNPTRYYVCDVIADAPGGTEAWLAWDKTTNKLYAWDGAAWLDLTGAGGGAPTTATYKTQTPDATLSAEEAWSLLGSGLVLNTTGTGVASIYAGTSCTNQFPRSLSASGASTCASVASADFGANILGLANGGTGLDTSATADDRVLVSAPWVTIALANGALAYNTTTDVFAQATFADVSGTVALAQITDDVSSGLCLLSGGGGDPAWTTCPGGGGGLSYAQVAAAALAGF